VFQPHIERLVGSPEESQQRAAAEMVYGLVRGMRFWNFRSAQQAWSWLLPVFQQVLNSVTLETQSDWDLCFSGASNKADPNRLRVMLELLVTSENLVSQGAFKESSYLLFVNKCLSQNWRIRELYNRTYNILRSHWDHPYTNVRHQIANTLATLLSMDIPILGVQDTFNVGTGFPTKKMFLDEVIPMLNLNYHNPEFSREETPVSGVGSTPSSTTETPNTSSEDVSMTMEVDEDTKKGNRILETVSLWILNQIKISSATITEEMFRILPFLCQFIGTETDQDVSQSCLQALCYMSTSILPSSAIEPLLEMTKKISHSSSYKTKLSMLEYIQVAVFTNFPKVVQNPGYRSEVQNQIIHLLQDENLTVRQKAGKILGGLLHSGFIDQTEITGLLKDLRTRIRPKMLRAGRRFKKVPTKETDDNSKDKIVLHHSGILGLCSFVEAFPYDVPSFVPPILMELSTHLNDAQPTPATIKKCLQEFKRTHQDNWQEHKTKFSEDQLVVMTDLLVSQNYYA
jgi:proteasome activator subunit 4